MPDYFNNDCYGINNELLHSYQWCINAHPQIRLPKICQQFAEFGLLYQLVNLLNNIYEYYPEIFVRIDLKSHSMAVIGVYIANIYIYIYIYIYI